jgi:hypothetical protein
MMKKVYKKSLVITIVVLFVGASVLPTIKGNIQSTYDENIKSRKSSLQNIVGFDVFGFDINENNNSIPLEINSDLINSTFLGGIDTDLVYDIKVDTNGYTYITGSTMSSNFPTTSGAYDTTYNGGSDAFITKLSPAGDTLIYSTFIGGTNNDQGSGIVVDANGYIYITGETYSSGFPTTSGAYDTTLNGDMDVFVTKISPSGDTLVYSTFLGGVDNDYGTDIKVDTNGYAYINGVTYSNDFPTTSGAYDTTYNGNSDAFIAKLSPSGNTLVYSTFIGGANNDFSYDITLDVNGHAYINGVTWSCNFPKTSGAYDTTYNGGSDAFITKLSPAGNTLVYSTFLGGTEDDYSSDILADTNGYTYIIGLTYSSGFPTTSGAYDTIYNGGGDVFITKLSQAGNALMYSTFLGGTNTDKGSGIVVDANGYICITGETRSSDFPTTPEAYNTNINGETDVFVAKLSPSGDTFVYCTYLGGTENDYWSRIGLDINGDSYITGITNSSDFPTTYGAYDTIYNGGDFDVFVAKFYLNNPPNNPSDPSPANGTINIDVNSILSWTCSDPDGDNLTYNVYFGTNSNPPLVSSGQSQNYYDPSGTMNYNTDYYWKIIAVDEHGTSTTGPIWSFTTGSEPNNPPNTPSNPSPGNGAVNINLDISVSWSCSDPDDDEIVYNVYFEANDNTPDVLVSNDQNVNIFNPDKLQLNTTYYWQIIAKDEHGASTIGPVWYFTTKQGINNPPDTPTITGPTKFKPNQEKEFTFETTDPNGDQYYYYIDWGDGNIIDWQGPYESGTIYFASHQWSEKTVFTIKCKAKDIYGFESDFGTLDISIPRSKILNSYLLMFIQNHPNILTFLQKTLNGLGH